jgi:hypothetical protein
MDASLERVTGSPIKGRMVFNAQKKQDREIFERVLIAVALIIFVIYVILFNW